MARELQRILAGGHLLVIERVPRAEGGASWASDMVHYTLQDLAGNVITESIVGVDDDDDRAAAGRVLPVVEPFPDIHTALSDALEA